MRWVEGRLNLIWVGFPSHVWLDREMTPPNTEAQKWVDSCLEEDIPID